MKKYLVTACLLTANNEFITLMVLLVLSVMFIFDMAGWTEGKL